MRRTARIAIFAVALALLAGALMAAQTAKSGYMEQTMSMKGPGASNTATARIYWKGDKIRTENPGGMITIMSGKTVYQYKPSQKQAMKMTMPKMPTVSQMFSQQAAMVKGAKKVGAATVAGFKCNVYIKTQSLGKDKGSMTAKIWLSTDPRLPIVMKMSYTAPGGRTQNTEVKNVKLNLSIPDSKFSLPKGTKVTDAKDMMKKAPAPKPPAKKK